MVSDRLGSPTMQLTQEFLADMIGARRSTVTLAAGSLQRSGVIEYRRGKINILDREGLEDAACECFTVTQRLFKSLYL
jgi:CRP-like cAMP-binding protein